MSAFWEQTAPTARLDRAEDVQPLKTLSLSEAQAWTNFVVYEPTWLPVDCTAEQTTLRPEQPPGTPAGTDRSALGQTPWSDGNPCSLRTIISGRGRRLRIKQFLYDWTPPFASVAPLWQSSKIVPLLAHNTVGWRGTDYMKKLGACIQLGRTQIELSVGAGNFSDQEFQQLLAGLQIANPEEARAVQQAPFHQLNYWVRYRYKPTPAPYGLWKYTQRRLYECGEMIDPETLPDVKNVRPLQPGDEDLAIDSALRMTNEALNHDEIELYVQSKSNPHQTFWMIAMNGQSPRALRFPPVPEEHSAEWRTTARFRDRRGWIAALTVQHGAWEALWEEEGHWYAVWSSALRGWDKARFLAFLEGLHVPTAS